jgi:hypothetical protein
MGLSRVRERLLLGRVLPLSLIVCARMALAVAERMTRIILSFLSAD